MNAMRVNDVIASVLTELGVTTVFGVVGSGNFHFSNALVAEGARFVAARHEGGAATMADAYARMSGEVAVLSLHQGCGFTNALTGIAEAAKSRTPLLVLTAEATDPRSNFALDQTAVGVGIGAVSMRIRSARTAIADVQAAFEVCRSQSRTVILNVPLDVQDSEVRAPERPHSSSRRQVTPPTAGDLEVRRLAELLLDAKRPVFIAGRGSRSSGAKQALRALAERTGALLATSAVARGLFADDPWNIDGSGGFSSPLTAELIRSADLVIGWGCALNMWTTRHGHLFADGATLVQVDLEQGALGLNRDIALGLWGDVTATASAILDVVEGSIDTGVVPRSEFRTEELRDRIATGLRWNQVAYDDLSGEGRIDARTLSIALDEALPAERVIGVDSGNFLGYPSMYLDAPDENGFCFTQAFQSVGLGLATAIGAALAQPSRVPVAACGDGGFLMGISELDTVVRLGLPMVIVVYNDSMYGAEVHHFGTEADLRTVEFPETDLAAIARGYGIEAITVREPGDLDAVTRWVENENRGPLLIDAKIISTASWWLQEAFGH